MCRLGNGGATVAVVNRLHNLDQALGQAQAHCEDLSGGWRRLQARYPESLWRVKQAFTEEQSPAAAREHREAA